jgi:hypothetical protein
MKLHSLTLATALLSALLPNATAQSFLTNGLVAYYPFNGNANDASGKGNNGTINEATLTQDRFGITNAAYSFSGINNYISFAGVPTSQVDNWTMTAWVKPASLNQMGIAVALGYDDGVSANGYSIVITGDASSSGNKLFAVFGGIPYAWVDSGFVFTSTSQWYQLVMLRNSGVTSFYVNGVLTPNSTTTTPYTPTSFRIGSENGLRFFNGAIDDVRIYNRALPASEVTELYADESGFCSPHAAQATAIVTNGFVVGATITDYGCGYTNGPLVLIGGGGGSNATATATIQNGFVTSINIINPGAGYYTTLPDILIGSPPFVPTLTINVSRVNVTQHVVLGFNYVLESSPDMINWTATRPPFTAQSEEITTEFVVNQTGQYFRIRQVP